MPRLIVKVLLGIIVLLSLFKGWASFAAVPIATILGIPIWYCNKAYRELRSRGVQNLGLAVALWLQMLFLFVSIVCIVVTDDTSKGVAFGVIGADNTSSLVKASWIVAVAAALLCLVITLCIVYWLHALQRRAGTSKISDKKFKLGFAAVVLVILWLTVATIHGQTHPQRFCNGKPVSQNQPCISTFTQ